LPREPREPREGSPANAQRKPSESPAANSKRPSVGEMEFVLGSPGSLVGLRGPRRTHNKRRRELGFFVWASRLWKKEGANWGEL
jgi:hypothetical protein